MHSSYTNGYLETGTMAPSKVQTEWDLGWWCGNNGSLQTGPCAKGTVASFLFLLSYQGFCDLKLKHRSSSSVSASSPAT
jgi:hypothetical protein